jgi:hypothetical protein
MEMGMAIPLELAVQLREGGPREVLAAVLVVAVVGQVRQRRAEVATAVAVVDMVEVEELEERPVAGVAAAALQGVLSVRVSAQTLAHMISKWVPVAGEVVEVEQ